MTLTFTRYLFNADEVVLTFDGMFAKTRIVRMSVIIGFMNIIRLVM